MGAKEETQLLLIEDSADDALVVTRGLRSAGFTGNVVHLIDPTQVFSYLAADADRTRCPMPQVILLDLKMPEVDGFEVLKWIRAQMHLSRILIIVLTRIENINQIQRAYVLGAHTFLSKDASREEMQNLVRFMDEWARRSAILPRSER